jgi:hypothetical protein
MDVSAADTNTNINTISPIDSELVGHSIFAGFLNFNYTTPPSTPTEAMFFKHLLNDEFVEHNKIPQSKISWITQSNMQTLAPGSGWTATSVAGKTYYTKTILTAGEQPEYYNIGNILVEIDLGSDFAYDYLLKYDLKRVGNDYRIRNGNGNETFSLTSERFVLREIVLYYKNDSGKFVPIYYARCNVTINTSGNYSLQIII